MLTRNNRLYTYATPAKPYTVTIPVWVLVAVVVSMVAFVTAYGEKMNSYVIIEGERV